jgi:hypothetical protein
MEYLSEVNAVPAAYSELAAALERISPARRDQLLNGEWELETPALRVDCGPQPRSLFIGSAHGVFTTATASATTQAFVKPVDLEVPGRWPCGAPRMTRVRGVQLVDADGAELAMQVRPV